MTSEGIKFTFNINDPQDFTKIFKLLFDSYDNDAESSGPIPGSSSSQRASPVDLKKAEHETDATKVVENKDKGSRKCSKATLVDCSDEEDDGNLYVCHRNINKKMFILILEEKLC
ncbi:hypothetical protein AVEN_250625-1 [Araneus ventricosus]|uniref:Uncharacterized protein n=1 Tax=Araneus ventricosus TaxID=182803 RepID=A0A4Y2QMP3_ARAVE|nr:hypothetical protein AVEN_250625-1 [Araneus ventricosus]